MGVEHIPVAVVGSGFAGIGASIALSRRGIEHCVLERADDLGGTWRDNTYPGCRCDVPSHLYSFSFALNPEWTETYSPQPEIWQYLRRVAHDHDVTRRIRFGHDVTDAVWNATTGTWELSTTGGPLTCDILILGNGPLAEPRIPDLPGLDSFAGTVFHSAEWRWDHDLTGERVAVIGTGASAAQFVPLIQPDVAHLTVFQRTPPWVLPHSNRRITTLERAIYRHVPLAQRFVRNFVYWSRELLIGRALVRNGKFLARVERLAEKALGAQVSDADLRARLTPSYRPGCKRLILSNEWYRA